MIEQFNDKEAAGARQSIGPEFIEQYPCHVIAAHVASELGLAGPNLVIPTACAAGNYALAHASDAIRHGEAEVMLAGGADAFSRITYTGFARLGAIAPERCQPFDKHRKGMVPGEGAAILVLERRDRAMARGATIYAELVGYGLTCDANHMTAPQGDGAARAMQIAMADAGVRPDEIGYISAHGTGTAHQRSRRDRRRQAGVRRGGLRRADELDQVDARPHDGRRVRHRGGGLHAGGPRQPHSADHEPRDGATRSAISTTSRMPRVTCRWSCR